MNIEKYDSKPDTEKHIQRVNELIQEVRTNLRHRGVEHDASKLEPPEKEWFDESTQRLRGTTYGSAEYKEMLEQMQPCLKHHYKHNSHHPEHYPNGIYGMCLLDLMEMLCDWKAATERHADGCLARSLEVNQTRFGYDDNFKNMLTQTALKLGWLPTRS